MKHLNTHLILLSAAACGLTACGAIAQVGAETVTLPMRLGQAPLNDNARAQSEQQPEQPAEGSTGSLKPKDIEPSAIELPAETNTYFGVFAGGGAPSYNEIALEKNVLYFQRSLTELGFAPELANTFFASGDPSQPTVRYLDDNGEEQFKAAEITNLDGGTTAENVYGWFEAVAQAEKSCPAFTYFTGHGLYNPENEDNNTMILWGEELLSVQALASLLDDLPAEQPFVTMMAQCYSGSFANLIYENGDPEQPVALQTRCGFFATVATRPSVGCTPAVNEADYKDYSSSFFAGLTGRDRTGNPVSSADYNADNQISYAEAHAFAKVDEETTDWPISTVEAWLQRQIPPSSADDALSQPIEAWSQIARPEQQYVIIQLTRKLSFDRRLSYIANLNELDFPAPNTVKEAYYKRLEMELVNIAAAKMIRDRQQPEELNTLEKLLACEAGSWQ